MKASSASSWLSAAQAAEYLGLPSTAALYKRVERRQVPVRWLGREMRFSWAELDALMAGVRRPPAAADAEAGPP